MAMRSIAIASGKGGVGKTTISLNLGLALAALKKRAVVVDADLAMANLGVMIGVEQAPITLHNVLRGELEIKDAVYEGPRGLKYVPAGLALDKAGRIDYSRLTDAVKQLADIADFVIIDSPPGLGPGAETALRAAKEIILVVTPEPSSLADAIKIKTIATRADVKIIGIVYNMVTGNSEEIKSRDVSTVLEAPIILEIPFDMKVRRSTAAQEPVFIKFPESDFTTGIKILASKVAGTMAIETSVKVKKGLVASIIGGISEFFSGLAKKAHFSKR